MSMVPEKGQWKDFIPLLLNLGLSINPGTRKLASNPIFQSGMQAAPTLMKSLPRRRQSAQAQPNSFLDPQMQQNTNPYRALILRLLGKPDSPIMY